MSERKTYVPELNKHVIESSVPADHTRHYLTSYNGHRPVFEPRIPDSSYADLLSGAVIKCVDVLIIDTSTEEVLLATRQQEPMAGRWVFGGRKRAGETNLETAVTNMNREFGLDINPEDFIDTDHEYDEIWDTRSAAHEHTQSSEGKPVAGCHTTSSAYVVPIDKSKIDLRGYNEEFRSTEWIPVDTILNSKSGEFHPALVDMVTDGLDALTKPDKPLSIDEAIFRAVTTLNHLHVRKTEQEH